MGIQILGHCSNVMTYDMIMEKNMFCTKSSIFVGTYTNNKQVGSNTNNINTYCLGQNLFINLHKMNKKYCFI